MLSLTTSETVDMEVKGPLIAQALSIVGVVDASQSELVAADSAFVLPAGGIEALDAAVARGELDRNRFSGDGFIRLFPDASDPLNDLLVVPPVSIEKYGLEVPGKAPVLFSIPEEDAMALFYHILVDVERRMSVSPSDPQLVARVYSFFVTQGYEGMRRRADLRSVLRQFMGKIRGMTTADALRRMAATSYRYEDVRGIVETIDETHVKCPGLLFE
jgi:hypothetical protein